MSAFLASHPIFAWVCFLCFCWGALGVFIGISFILGPGCMGRWWWERAPKDPETPLESTHRRLLYAVAPWECDRIREWRDESEMRRSIAVYRDGKEMARVHYTDCENPSMFEIGMDLRNALTAAEGEHAR